MEKIDDLIKSHTGLVNELRRCDRFSVSRLVAGLLTLPEFHANTIRLDALAHLACLVCKGKKEADREMLQRCAGRHLADFRLAQMEDPVEDVFIGNVATTRGNFRLFRGLQESGDLYLEWALRPFQLSDLPNEASRVFDRILNLLRLSEAVAEDLKCHRYASGGGSPSHRLAMPSWRILSKASSAVTFSANRLVQLGISKAELMPFVFSESNLQKLTGQTLGHTDLERYPLLEKGEDLLLAVPHAVTTCVVRYLVEELDRLGFLSSFQEMLYKQQATDWFEHFLHRLGFRLCNVMLPHPPSEIPVAAGCVMTFDEGKYAHCLFLDGNIRGCLENSVEFDQFNSHTEAAFQCYLKDCAVSIMQQTGFSGGMTLITRGGLGRAFMMGLPDVHDDWEIVFAGINDWGTIARCSDMSALRLWRMYRQRRWAVNCGTTIRNLSGLLNIYGWWRRNGWKFYSRDMSLKEPPTMMFLGTDFLTDVRRDIRLSYDRHACRAHNASHWVLLEKKGGTSYFAEEKADPLYVVLETVKDGLLQGMVKTVNREWWIVTNISSRRRDEKSAVYQLWDCLLNWTKRIAPIAEEAFKTLPRGSISLDLNIQNVSQWLVQTNDTVNETSALPFTSVDAATRTIRIDLPPEFARQFQVPDNRAERALIFSACSALSTLAGLNPCEAFCAALVARIVPNEDARYFHIAYTENLANILTAWDRPEPEFIPEEDLSHSLVGLAEEIGDVPAKGGMIRGESACLEYLQKAVDKMWERVERLLRRFDRKSVVTTCCSALAEFEKDAEQWRLTARAQLALHRDHTDVLNVAAKRRTKQDTASLTSRLLIETAMYACPEEGGRSLPDAERLELLAHLQNLVSVANYRDAISRGFMPAEIKVFANGELGVDETTFFMPVMAPYLQAVSDKGFRTAASRYEQSFVATRKNSASTRIKDVLSRMERPFLDEYGLSIETFLSTAGELGHLAVQRKTLLLEFTEEEFRAFLKERCQLNLSETNSYISNFTLPPRSAWNKDLPDGLTKNDVYPWRFRRRLSLIMRPLIQIGSKAEKRWIIYPPLLVRSAPYLLQNLGEASFPTEHFRSASMRQFCGEQANLQGHQFNAEVADLVQSCGFNVRTQVAMSSLGVPSSEGDLGDVDVIAWRVDSNEVLAIECKNLRDAISVRDVVDRLDEYRGTRDDDLSKHLRRVEWLTQNPSGVSTILGIAPSSLRIKSLLVTSDLVPMQFFSGSPMPTEDVIAIHQLCDYLKKLKRR